MREIAKLLTTLSLIMFLCLGAQASDSDKSGFIKPIKTAKGYKLEIPDHILGREVLFGSRIVDLSSPSAKVYAAGQTRTPPVVIRFEKRDKYIIIQDISNTYIVDPADPIYNAVKANSTIGVSDIFEIESRNGDNTASVIDVTKYFSEEVSLAWPLPENVKKGRLESRFTNIEFMKEYPDHLNVRTHYEFVGGKEPFSITVQYYLMLLSDEPMAMRLADSRVGYQSISLKSYAAGEPIKSSKFISRWRIEPSKADAEKHRKGDLVEPAKPIVFYIDPTFPVAWVPYIKQAVEDWQPAFEAIGFKNAIVAREYPSDPNFDPYDISVNTVRYLPVEEANAAGQIWINPRNGEILQADVLWWNNVIELTKMWRFTQTAAVDPRARQLNYDDKMMGEMIRYAIAHEVGHTLGLQHNMRASYAYPADSLRSPSFTQKYGTTASIMDYARYNHFAQPGDFERGVRLTPPYLGPYDVLSIDFGYRVVYGAKTPAEELSELDKIFKSKGNDPKYIFGPAITAAISPDPSSQSESLSDDVIKSSAAGIKNTRLILSNFVDWTLAAGGGRDVVSARYDALSKQYFRYISLSLSYVGGLYQFQGEIGEQSERFVAVSPKRQKETIAFAIKSLREAPKYLDTPNFTTILGSQRENIIKRQGEIISSLLNPLMLPRVFASSSYKDGDFTLEQYFSEIERNILVENPLKTIYDEAMNIAYVQALNAIAARGEAKNDDPGTAIVTAVYAQAANNSLLDARKFIESKISAGANRAHYGYLLSLIK